MNIETLLQRADIWRGGDTPPAAGATLVSGFSELDALLPGGGWPQGALTEVLAPRESTGTLSLLMPTLAALSRQGRWLAYVMPPHIPYAPALAERGVDLSRLLWIRCRDEPQALWAVEQLLRSRVAGAVLAWPSRLQITDLRRLQLAAEEAGSWGVLFRPPGVADEPTPAALRLQVEPCPDGISVTILKRRGGWPAGPVHLAVDGR
jgi:hypothetical protein